MPFSDIWSDPTVRSIQRFLKTNRLFPIFIFLIILFPVVDLAFFNYTQTKQALTTTMLSRREAIASLVSDLIEEKLIHLVSIGESLASDEQAQVFIKAGEWEKALQLIEDTPSKFPAIDRIAFYDTQGVLKADVPRIPSLTGQSFSFRDWYQGVIRSERPYVSTVYKRIEDPQENVVAVAVPIFSQDDTGTRSSVLGTLVMQVTGDTLLGWIQEIDIGEEGFISITDQKGQIVAHPEFPSQGEIVSFADVRPVQNALRGDTGVVQFYNDVEKEEQLTAFAPVDPFGWTVQVAQPASTAFANRESNLRAILFVYGFAAVLMIVLGYVLLHAYAIARSQAVFIAREMTASLRDSEERYRKLIETSPDAILVTDLQTNIVMLNKQAVKILGYERESELVGKNSFSFVAPEDQEKTKQSLGNLLQVGRVEKVEYMNTRKDGSRFFASSSASVMTDRNGKPQWIIAVVRDVTKDKELDHLKDEFISLSSHELRTPMTAIKGYISMILNGKYGELNEPIKKPLVTIASATERLINLVNDILSVSRIETKRLRLNLSSCVISDLLGEVISSVEPMAKERSLRLTVTVPKEIAVQADPDKLKQVFINLLANAIKFTDRGEVSISSKDEGEQVIFFIVDTGIGISKESQDHLFGKFQQISTEQAGRPPGTGLGLYISREYARAMGGEVSIVVSEQGKGSTFAISLPKAGSQLAREVMEEVTKKTHTSMFGSTKSSSEPTVPVDKILP